MWFYHVSGIKDGEHYFVHSFESELSPDKEKNREDLVEEIIRGAYRGELEQYEGLYVVAVSPDWGTGLCTQSYDLEYTPTPVFAWTPAKFIDN